ncbi:MAG: HEAT repeat domain-containing protein [Gammaproteobacteria bacterium]|nr:HEAT repeat domain-containing protein [Gammaproteobacteria bacterium]
MDDRRPAAPDALDIFVEQVCGRYDRERPQSFWALGDEFCALAHSGWAAAYLNRELERLCLDPGHFGDWQLNQLIAHRGRGWALAIWLFEQPRQYLHSTPFHGMFAPLGADSLRYDLYQLPPDHRNEVFDPGQRLTPAGAGCTGPGGLLLLRGEQYVYDFKPPARPLPVLKFTSAAIRPLEWLFKRDTRYAWQANDAALNFTQLRVAAHVLGRLAQPSSAQPLSFLSGHAHHAVRWAAIQNLARVNRSAALERLQRAADGDPHPHLRKAAQRSLQALRQPG